MAQYQWQNNVRTVLTNAITNSQTSIEVNEAVAPLLSPPTPAGGRVGILTLVDNLYVPTKIEIITYTGVTDNGATLTLTGVTRGVDGTTGQAFDAGAPCYQAVVKIMANHVQDPTAVAITGGTINGATIGATTPATGAFTSITATASITAGLGILSFASSIGAVLRTHGADAAGEVGTNTAHDLKIIRNSVRVGFFTSTGLNDTVIGATTRAAGSFTTLLAKLDSDANFIVTSENATNGASANAGFKSLSDTANMSILSHATVRTTTRCGQVLGGWNEILSFVGGGLLVNTNGAAAIKFGTNNTLALTLDSSQNATFAGTIAATSITGTGTILADGSAAAFGLDRRDTGALKWVLYSAAGSLQIYDNASGVDRVTLTDGGRVTTANAAGTDGYINVTISGVSNNYIGFNNSGSANGFGVPNNTMYIGCGNGYGMAFLTNGGVAATLNTVGTMQLNLPTGASSDIGLRLIKAGGFGETTFNQFYVSASDYGLRVNTDQFEVNAGSGLTGTKKAYVVHDVFAITAVSTAGQTRTLDFANGSVQTVTASEHFTMNFTGPAGKAGWLTLYIYNSAGSIRNMTAGTGGFGTVGVVNCASSSTEALQYFWDGYRMQCSLTQKTHSGDARPT